LFVPKAALVELAAVVLMSVRAQLQLGGGLARPAASLAINIDGSVNGSRCVAAAWVPGSQGRSFITAHRDGGVYLHQKVWRKVKCC